MVAVTGSVPAPATSSRYGQICSRYGKHSGVLLMRLRWQKTLHGSLIKQVLPGFSETRLCTVSSYHRIGFEHVTHLHASDRNTTNARTHSPFSTATGCRRRRKGASKGQVSGHADHPTLIASGKVPHVVCLWRRWLECWRWCNKWLNITNIASPSARCIFSDNISLFIMMF